ncbi:MAG TPA: alpha-glucan family phosphorylase [Tepidiformaceae bacterium]|nr:alpha-glucan family phosphorylase [Tepidiformaceae bacterium]
MANDGSAEMRAARDSLASRLPGPLRPLARLAYDYWWSWDTDSPDLFRTVDFHIWRSSGENPVRLLQEATPERLAELSEDQDYVSRLAAAVARLDAYLQRPPHSLAPGNGPLAFMCAEFGIHPTLPIYAGGLGVLAGDYLKEASDRACDTVAVGLAYWQGSFHQRLDADGWQHEYWIESDVERLPAVQVRDESGRPLRVTVEIRSRPVAAAVWRVDVGRVPLFALDANLPENSPLDRWITARLYIGDRETRLCQYALLGLGGIRALEAMGFDPSAIHLNEGHAALATLELLRQRRAEGIALPEAVQGVREKTFFTTHTPVAAGNDTYSPDELRRVLGDQPLETGLSWDEWLALGEARRGDPASTFAITALALRLSNHANGVSRRHGEVARRMWAPVWGLGANDPVPISHVTNGVHLPTWMSPPMQALLDRQLPSGWRERADEPETWAAADAIPDGELWALRRQLRGELVSYIQERSVQDRLARGRSPAYAEGAAREWDADTLTVGFARRIATYKRLHLLTLYPERAVRLISSGRGAQLVLAGKAHPQDEEAKRTVAGIFAIDEWPGVGEHVVFLDEYDIATAQRLVAGCDLWINLPRPPLEASGTSGMKSVLNGGLQLSVLDGWWAEAFAGDNGWAIRGDERPDASQQDADDAGTLLDLLEQQVLPLFYERDADGVARGWVRMVKRSLSSLGPLVNATRMLEDYAAVFAEEHE